MPDAEFSPRSPRCRLSEPEGRAVLEQVVLTDRTGILFLRRNPARQDGLLKFPAIVIISQLIEKMGKINLKAALAWFLLIQGIRMSSPESLTRSTF